MEYKFSDIENKIKELWKQKDIYHVTDDTGKPKYYVLDMFPYPSGAGLHVGHPLGYIASDIYARYKRMKGFNVLHPMGYDSFGLPAEQYAIQTGQHPAVTTKNNITRFREQMDKMGFSFDWSREVKTSDPEFYKWTQWIFIQLFNSWYNQSSDRAENISSLVKIFETDGNAKVKAAQGEVKTFSADEWKELHEKEQQEILMQYRLAFLDEAYVNWCPALGSVLANDEVKDGVSERGGYPVERKKMKQWMLRITAYSERLLKGLDELNWSESIKEAQRNWIGKSEGCSVKFWVSDAESQIEVFTTRPDTLFGVTFLTLAPEHELIEKITPASHKKEVDAYVQYAKNRSERERMTEVKKITGQFTGAYAIHPFTGKKIPVWIGEYVLAGYGTGAVMAVPGHDSRDYAFAKHFGMEIIEVIKGGNISKEAFEGEGVNINSSFLDGLKTSDAKKKVIEEIEKKEIGERKINYKQRDAVFGRQRYWGEPIPVYYDEQHIPRVVDVTDLPVQLPEVEKYLPTDTGEPPLARAKNWKYKGKYNYELTTMPGWAGSSWYFFRYMDPHNPNVFAGKDKLDYWKQVDFYIGGSEHATGHLLYFRFWTKFLKDLGFVTVDEPAKRLVNQGMIQGVSQYIEYRGYRNEDNIMAPVFLYKDIKSFKIYEEEYQLKEIAPFVFMSHTIEGIAFPKENLTGSQGPVNIDCVDDSVLNFEKFEKEYPHFKNSVYLTPVGYYQSGEFLQYKKMDPYVTPTGFNHFQKFRTRPQTEKMSKSKYNVVNPDEVIDKYGADCFRLYEMFLGPIELSKPWDTKGIDGVSRFLKKLWKLFYSEDGKWLVTNETATQAELKILHKTIKKVEEDIERLSYNTSVSAFMICVNELTDLHCHKSEVLKNLLLILAPFAPFTTEFLWQEMKQEGSIVTAAFPEVRTELLVENTFEYPIAINGKTRTKIELPLDMLQESIEKEVLSLESVQKYLEGKTPKKVIVVKGRMVNVVV